MRREGGGEARSYLEERVARDLAVIVIYDAAVIHDDFAFPAFLVGLEYY